MNYRKIYKQLMQRAKVRRPFSGTRYERHHIKPKCLKGSNKPSNIVLLTPAEHYVAHQLLVKIYPGNGKLIWAALAMTGTGRGRGNGRKGNKLYGWLRNQFVANQTGKPRWSDEVKAKIGAKSKERNQGENHPMYGRTQSAEACALISVNNIGKHSGPRAPFTPEHCLRISEARKRFFAEGGTIKDWKHKEETKSGMRAYWAKRRELGLPCPANTDAVVYAVQLKVLAEWCTVQRVLKKQKTQPLAFGRAA